MTFHRLHALVVDNCVHMRAIVVAVLRGVGFERIREAGDGVEALSALRETPVDFMVLDESMPIMTGIELAQMLRLAKDSPSPFLPIIMMTAHSERRRILAARDAGINEFVAKPLSARTLLDRVTAIIDRPRAWVHSGKYHGPCRRRRIDPKYGGQLRRASDQSFDLDAVRTGTGHGHRTIGSY